MNNWHRKQQSYFKNTEIPIANYRADAVLNNMVFEFQDKHIMTKEEINRKNTIYKSHHYIPVWILNMNYRMIIKDDHNIKCNNFIDEYVNCENLFLSHNNQIIIPSQPVAMSEKSFYNYIKIHKCLPPKSEFKSLPKKIRYPFELKYQQYGAGGGKTYGIIKDIVKQMQSIKDFNVIILTKVHTAKSEIRKKLIEDFHPKNIIEKSPQGGKYYEFHLNGGCCVIATIDSFLYNVIDKDYLSNTHSQNIFRELANGLEDENKLSSNVIFKNIPIIKSKVYIDEAQDLSKEYICLIKAVSRMYGAEFILVGDVWQSLYDINNLYYTIIKNPPKNCKITRLNPDMKYYCRRFHNINLATHHNDKFYNNQQFMQSCNNMGLTSLRQLIETENIKFDSNEKLQDEYVIENPVSEDYVNDPDVAISNDKNSRIPIKVINKEKYQELENLIINIFKSIPSSNPQDWCIICPFMKGNYVAHQLVNTINTYWHSIKNVNDSLLLCKLYSSENGQPIKIEGEDRENKTLMMTIHASKGQTFKYVICLGCQYDYIKVYPQCCKSKNLFYWSMINVAWTRASHNMFIINYKSNSRELYYTSPREEDFEANNERIINILNKVSWYKDYENKYKLQSKQSCSTNILIDNNYQTLRYHIISSLMKFRLSYVHGSGQIYAKMLSYAEKGFLFCNNTKEFMSAARDFVKDIASKPIPLYDYTKYYPNAMKRIKEVCKMYKELAQVKDNNDEVKMFKDKINKDISILLIWGYLMFQRNGNVYKQNDYQTLCEALELISTGSASLNKNITNYMYKVQQIIRQTFNTIGNMEKIGFSNTSYPFTWSINKPNTIYSPNVFMVPLLNKNRNESKSHFGDMDENIKCAILNPINTDLNFINFDAEVLKALIVFVCIKAETNQEKKLILIAPSNDPNNVVIEFDFRGQINQHDYETILKYIKDTCVTNNMELGYHISNVINSKINSPLISSYELNQIVVSVKEDKELKKDNFVIKILNNLEGVIVLLQSCKAEDAKEFIKTNVEKQIEYVIMSSKTSYAK